MKNKALIVLPTDKVGGAERVAQHLVKYLVSKKIFDQVDVYFLCKGRTGGWDGLEGISGLTMKYNNYGSEKYGVFPLMFFMFLVRKQYSLVYSTHANINAFLSLMKKINVLHCQFLVARESTVIKDRFTGIKGGLCKLLYLFYGAHDLIICQTSYMAESMILSYPRIKCQTIKVIPNPIDLSLFSNVSVSSCESTEFVAIVVGRLIPVKNHELVIRALSGLKSEGVLSSNFKLYIAGDGYLFDSLLELTKSEGIVDHVKFLGNLKSPYELMSRADLGIVCSNKEGFPNVILEMMASGTKNIIATPCAGDLDKLHGLNLLKDFEIDGVKAKIVEAYNDRPDNSKLYQYKMKKRSVGDFWNAIKKELKHND